MSQLTRVEKRNSTTDIEPVTANSGMLKVIRNQVKNTLGRISNGSITVTDPVETYVCGEQQTDLAVTITIRDLDFYRLVALEGSNGAAQAYIDSKWDTDNLTGLVQILVRNIELLDEMEGGLAWIKNSVLKVWHYFNKNSISGSKGNISAHYDLGNEFFKLFLDKHMMYSSAIYEADESLEEASERKLKTICEKLDLKPTDKVIEIGTGWGGMAIYAAKNYGCHVTTTTISEQQYQYAKKRIIEEGLEDKVELLKNDYRDLRGSFDKLVSIEMIEAVGHHYLDTYIKKCSELLKSNGLALIQAITIEDRRYKQALKSVDFIKRYIFPGSFIPCVSAVVSSSAHNSDLRLINLEDFGESYAKTLNHWRDRFNANLEEVKGQGYSDQFIRMWEFYLCYCEGGFIEKSISDTHLLFAKPENKRKQWLAQR
ncbi:SAM-dependent methyltransferase [Kangiella taiwanensis]|uniref:Cyclopropane-fatty-acyl-phospholipid synthase family protein n=1 Tax=Kangiella taiwanensis TaxID=1079179 RepID=A0ABP8HVD9_9GAMM|nr:cyclopropane-fatty-acyl-phospholipid synthase family protein [Kangiella taiwanensis]